MAWVFNWLEKNSYRKSENDTWLQRRKSDTYMGNVYAWECVRYNNNNNNNNKNKKKNNKNINGE